MMPGSRDAPFPLKAYSGLSALVGPLIYPRIAKKLLAQGTAPERVEERKGYATEARPAGRLLWCHAASVGESVSVLRLIAELGQKHRDLSFLLTSGTATSAQIVAKRLPPRTQHQFAPMDTHKALNRFMDHWAPTAALFVESELWPNMLRKLTTKGIPAALVNARISDRSARNWARAPATSRHLMQPFRMIHCQDTRTAEHLQALGLSHARKGPNLKSMAAPLPVDMNERDRLREMIGKRPVWLASSTHPGEDEIVLTAHQQILKTHPSALLILVPRHPERAGDIAALITNAGLKAHQRSEGQSPNADTQVYMADTLGETGLWYALCPVTCICGSFSPVGGHNLFEPAQGGSAILHGPLYANFAEIYAEFDGAGAAKEVAGASPLAQAVLEMLEDPKIKTQMTKRAEKLVMAQDRGLAELEQELSKALELG